MTTAIRGELVYASVTLVVETCCTCGAAFAFEEGMKTSLLRTHNLFYCPAGHGQSYTGKSEAERLREQRNRLEAQLTAERDQHRATELSRRALKGQLTKTRRRVGKGVCPACTRTFPNLAAHMETKHPDFVEQPS